MGPIGVDLLTVAGLLVVLAAPLEVATGTLLLFWLLVPGLLSVPHVAHILYVNRLILYGFAARLLLRSGRRGEPAGAAYALTPMHGVLAAALAVSWVNGVVLAPRHFSLAGDIHGWYSQLDLAVLYVVVLAAVRTLGGWRVVRWLVVGLSLAVAIGLCERATGWGWARFFFEHLPASYQAAGSAPLQTRGGAARSTGAAQFALEYGWVLVALLPLAAVAAGRWSRARSWSRPWTARLAVFLPLATAVAVFFSGGRSPEVAVGVELLLLALLVGADAQLLRWLLGGLLLAGLALVVHPGLLTRAFTASTDPASVRLNRLPVLFLTVSGRPYVGNGFEGTLFGVDNGYVVLYVTMGMAGLLTWCAALVAAAGSSVRAAMGPRRSTSRALGVACLLGVVANAVANAVYDLVNTPQSHWALFVLAAVAVAAAERVAPRRARRRRWLLRALLPAAGVGLGFVVMAAAPVNAAQTLALVSTAPWVSAESGGPTAGYSADVLTDTACGLMTDPLNVLPGTEIHCFAARQFFGAVYPPLIDVLVRGRTPAAVAAEVHHARAVAAPHVFLAGGTVGPPTVGRPALATTAPLTLGALGLLLMLAPGPRLPAGDGREPGEVVATAEAATDTPAPRTRQAAPAGVRG